MIASGSIRRHVRFSQGRSSNLGRIRGAVSLHLSYRAAGGVAVRRRECWSAPPEQQGRPAIEGNKPAASWSDCWSLSPCTSPLAPSGAPTGRPLAVLLTLARFAPHGSLYRTVAVKMIFNPNTGSAASAATKVTDIESGILFVSFSDTYRTTGALPCVIPGECVVVGRYHRCGFLRIGDAR